MLTIQEAVNEIKILIEDAIVKGGVEGKNNLMASIPTWLHLSMVSI